MFLCFILILLFVICHSSNSKRNDIKQIDDVFADWVENVSSIESVTQVAIDDFGLKGLAYTVDVNKGDLVIAVPREDCIAPADVQDENSNVLKGLPKEKVLILKDMYKLYPQSSILSILLVLHRDAPNPLYFTPYVKSLPKKLHGSIRYWGEEERQVGQHLQAYSAFYEDESYFIGEFHAMTKVLPPQLGLGSEIKLEDFLWGLDMVGSRVFSLELDNSTFDNLILVPYGDLPNYSGDKLCDMDWAFNKPRNAFVTVASCSKKQGEPAYLYYGCKSNNELLAEYGFTLNENPCKHVSIEYGEEYDCKLELEFSATSQDCLNQYATYIKETDQSILTFKDAIEKAWYEIYNKAKTKINLLEKINNIEHINSFHMKNIKNAQKDEYVVWKTYLSYAKANLNQPVFDYEFIVDCFKAFLVTFSLSFTILRYLLQ